MHVGSGLSVVASLASRLAESKAESARFHGRNPPIRMVACEIVCAFDDESKTYVRSAETKDFNPLPRVFVSERGHARYSHALFI